MNKNTSTIRSERPAFVFGFVLSLLLTILVFALIGFKVIEGLPAIILIMISAIAQVVVQLFFFLHLGREKAPRWNGKMFLFTVIMIAILVIGTLWVMQNLDYNMSSHDAAEYLLQDEGLAP